MSEHESNDRLDRAIAQVADGVLDALGDVYDLMARHIYVTAYAVTANRADAEDALQDTMLQIVRYARSYRAGSSPRAWILTLARHRAIDIVRRRRPTVPMEDERLAALPDPQSGVEGEAVLSLLDALRTEDRQLVILRLYDELSYAEIAHVMGISVAAAEKRYQRALKRLRAAYLS